MARRDLDFAPDARGGFEMTLLRMLAFRPESFGEESLDERARSVPAPAATAPSARSSARSPMPPATLGPEPAVPADTAAASKAASGDWSEIVAGLGLQGPVTQLAAHCVLVGRKGDVVQLRLDPTGSTFRRPQLEQKLAEALSRHYGETVRLSITASDAEEPTPARAKAQAADERQRSAEQAIESDANVRALREVFGATVQPGSVKPLN